MKLVNLVPLKEGSMQARELADYNSLEELQAMYDQLMRDMEQEAEPEGGPIADQYADQMQDIEDAMQMKRGKTKDVPYDVAIGRMSRDEFEKSSKFNRMNETTEKSWNAIDVSRKAEKEISNKEWNERTGKKLDILKKLNDAGKFKKDFDDERLQGWVDSNYSWEKLSKQFELKEAHDKMFDFENEVDEGSCGYGPKGIPGDTPGETQGMKADDRTNGMLRMLIQKEIAKLKEGNFDDRLKSMMGDDDFEKATSKDVPGLGDTVIDDKTNISTGRKTFLKMMIQFTDEPFLIETGLKLYDAWARGEGGLKPSRILKILQDTRN